MQLLNSVVVTDIAYFFFMELIWLTEVKMCHVNDFYRVEQLHLLKLKVFLNFESSTHSVVVKWPVEFGFIVGSHYVQVYPLANQIRVHTCKNFFFHRISSY